MLSLADFPGHFVEGELAGEAEVGVVGHGDKAAAAEEGEKGDNRDGDQAERGSDHELDESKCGAGSRLNRRIFAHHIAIQRWSFAGCG